MSIRMPWRARLPSPAACSQIMAGRSSTSRDARSRRRRAMLEAAGVPFEATSPGVDEEAAKASLRADGCLTRDLADALAELKALKISGRNSDALVLGSDSIVELQDGRLLDKPEN